MMMPFKPRRPFVGGSLDSQKQWERANLCCFHLAGQCKFTDRCRFSHDDDGVRPCQFGQGCRMGHAGRALPDGVTSPPVPPPTAENAAVAPAEASSAPPAPQ